MPPSTKMTEFETTLMTHVKLRPVLAPMDIEVGSRHGKPRDILKEAVVLSVI